MKQKKKLFIVISIITMMLIIILFVILNKMKKENFNNNDNNIYLSNEQIIDLLSYVPNSSVKIKNYDNAYCGKKVTFSEISEAILSPIFMSNYTHIYKFEDINLQNSNIQVENIFLNTEINQYLMTHYNYDLGLLENVNTEIDIINLNDEYTAFNDKKIDNIVFLPKVIISTFSSSVTKKDAIIIEKAVFYMSKDNKYYVYKNSNISNDNLIKIYDKIDKDGKKLDYNIFDKIKEDFVDYKGEFKHTFKKNKTGYYWYSTEFIEDK